MQSKIGSVYLLVDPRDGRVRYVGQTTIDPHRRLGQHIKARTRRRSHCSSWITSVLASGHRPLVRVVETSVTDGDLLDALEREWITSASDLGWSLVNDATGGRGKFHMSAETRAKIGISMRRIASDPNFRARVSADHKGKPKSVEWRARVSAAQRGRVFTEEHRIRLSEAAKARHARNRAARAERLSNTRS